MKVMLSWLMMWCCKQGSFFLTIKEQRLIDFQWCSRVTCWLSQWGLRKGDHVSAQRDKPWLSSGREDAVSPPSPLRHLGLTDCRYSIYHSGDVELWVASFSNEVTKELASAAGTYQHTYTAVSESKSRAFEFNHWKVQVLMNTQILHVQYEFSPRQHLGRQGNHATQCAALQASWEAAET